MIEQNKAIKILKEHSIDWRYVYTDKADGFVDLTKRPSLEVRDVSTKPYSNEFISVWIKCPDTSIKLFNWLGY